MQTSQCQIHATVHTEANLRGNVIRAVDTWVTRRTIEIKIKRLQREMWAWKTCQEEVKRDSFKAALGNLDSLLLPAG